MATLVAVARDERSAGLPGGMTTVFLLGLLVAATGVFSPAVALGGGLAFGLLVREHPLRREGAALSKLLLQASVVALGFGMDLREVLRAGRASVGYTAVSIAAALTLGLALGRLLKVKGRASFLIAAGTAICGGSAIAALAPINEAGEEEISVAMGTVFLLNAVALVAFPAIGTLLGLRQEQFGLWAALAIHDTSSVVGAAAHYGPVALAVGTTVKLVRAMWILPVSLATAAYMKGRRTDGGKGGGAKFPVFILLFCAAAGLHAALPGWMPLFTRLNGLGKCGLAATLFLIGAGMSRNTLREVGVRPLVQGVMLWVVVASVSLLAICKGWVGI